ncbi:MAG: hypothetical protein V4605_02915, partial [Pseudomonadota bacterium]
FERRESIFRLIGLSPVDWLTGGYNLYQYVRNPIRWADPLGLSPIMLDPNTLNYSQSWISPNNYADVMAKKGWIGDPLNVINRNGNLVSFDNRRLDASQALAMKEVPVNMVEGFDPYPASTTGKTWNDAFDERLKRNGLSEIGTSERPVVGKAAGADQIAKNRGKMGGCY